MYERESNAKWIFIGGGIVVGLIVVGLALWGSFFVVEPGDTSLVQDMRSGVLPQTFSPGTHGKTPFFQKEIEINTRQATTSPVSAVGTSKDLQEITTEWRVTYQVVDVSWLYQNVGITGGGLGEGYPTINIEPILDGALQSSAKTCISPYNADQINDNREAVRKCVADDISGTLQNHYKTNVVNVFMTDLNFTDQFNQAIEAKQVAAQQLLQQQAESQKGVVQAEADLQKTQIQANATRINADAQAYATEQNAKAQAEAAQIINEALAKNPLYIQYLQAQRWDGHLPSYVGGNGPMPFLSVDAKVNQP